MVQVRALLIMCFILEIINGDNVFRYGEGFYQKPLYQHIKWPKEEEFRLESSQGRQGNHICLEWCAVTFYNGLFLERRYDCCRFKETPGECPSVTLCSWPLPYFLTNVYQCFSDYSCPQNHKCCEDSCFLHKVCHPKFASRQIDTTLLQSTTQNIPNRNVGSTERVFETTENIIISTIKTTSPTTDLVFDLTSFTSLKAETTSDQPERDTETTTFISTAENTPLTTLSDNSEHNSQTPIYNTTELSISSNTTEGITAQYVSENSANTFHTRTNSITASTYTTTEIVDEGNSGSGDYSGIPDPRSERDLRLWNPIHDDNEKEETDTYSEVIDYFEYF